MPLNIHLDESRLRIGADGDSNIGPPHQGSSPMLPIFPSSWSEIRSVQNARPENDQESSNERLIRETHLRGLPFDCLHVVGGEADGYPNHVF